MNTNTENQVKSLLLALQVSAGLAAAKRDAEAETERQAGITAKDASKDVLSEVKALIYSAEREGADPKLTARSIMAANLLQDDESLVLKDGTVRPYCRLVERFIPLIATGAVTREWLDDATLAAMNDHIADAATKAKNATREALKVALKGLEDASRINAIRDAIVAAAMDSAGDDAASEDNDSDEAQPVAQAA